MKRPQFKAVLYWAASTGSLLACMLATEATDAVFWGVLSLWWKGDLDGVLEK